MSDVCANKKNGGGVNSQKNGFWEYGKFFLIFCLGVLGGLCLWDCIFLSFSNPFHVVGPLVLQKFNPNNNLVRFVCLVFTPSILLLLAGITNFFPKVTNFLTPVFTEAPFFQPSERRKSWTFLLILAALLASVYSFCGSTYSTYVDGFHEGECLAPAISWLEGKIPYRDFILSHGPYEDMLRPVLGFQLFGESIGAARTMQSISEIVCLLLLAAFLVFLYEMNFFLVFFNFMVLLALRLHGFLFIAPRDSVVFLFLVMICLMKREMSGKKERSRFMAVLGFLLALSPSIAFAYSIDRGLSILFAYFLLFPIGFVLLRGGKERSCFAVFSLAGALSGMFCLHVLLRGGTVDFLKYVFWEMPKFKNFYDGYIYPIFSGQEKSFLFFPLLISANLYWLAIQFARCFKTGKDSVKLFFRQYLVMIALAILSVALFLNALGRADRFHLNYSLVLSYLLTVYIFIYEGVRIFSRPFSEQLLSRNLLLGCIGAMLIYMTLGIYKENLVERSFPLAVPDARLIRPNDRETITFLKQNLVEGEEFLALTPEAIWYYFLRQASPTRFPVLWFAATDFQQREFVEGLKKANVRFLIRQDHGFFDRWADGIENEARHPIIFEYIKEHYVFYKKIGAQEIWIKK